MNKRTPRLEAEHRLAQEIELLEKRLTELNWRTECAVPLEGYAAHLWLACTHEGLRFRVADHGVMELSWGVRAAALAAIPRLLADGSQRDKVEAEELAKTTARLVELRASLDATKGETAAPKTQAQASVSSNNIDDAAAVREAGELLAALQQYAPVGARFLTLTAAVGRLEELLGGPPCE